MGFFKPNVQKMMYKGDVQGLIRALKEEDMDIRERAAEALRITGDTRAVEPLIEALKDKEKRVRERAARTLGYIGDAKAVEPLIQALKDEYYDVRSSAALSLGDIGDDRAVEPLIQALKDKDYCVRLDAASALGDIGDDRAVEPLIKALKDKDEGVREEAAEALGKIKPEIQVKPASKSILYLWVIGQNRKPSKKLLNEVLDHYGEEGVVILGGHKANTLPQEPDISVVTVCLKACKENNIAFDSDRDEIAYSIDNVYGEEVGICKIRVHVG